MRSRDVFNMWMPSNQIRSPRMNLAISIICFLGAIGALASLVAMWHMR
jgi:hypothetical protein